MTLLVIRLALAHARSSPGDLLAVALLLAAAALVPGSPNDLPIAGLALSGVVAVGATAAALAKQYEQRRMLRRNGAGPWLVASVATLAVLIPGSVAAAALLAIATATGAALNVAGVLEICLGVPAATALLLALRVARREASHRPARRRLTEALSGVAKAVSLFLVLAIAVGLGSSETWFGLALLLFFAGPVLVLAVAVLGSTWTGLLGRHAGTTGPLALLAIGPLRRRRGLLLPLTAVLSVVVSLAAVEGVVGTSFGEREERRLAALSSVEATAGLSGGHAIGAVSAADPDDLVQLADAVAARDGVHITLVHRIGDGGTANLNRPTSGLDFSQGPDVHVEEGDPDHYGPSWIGVVDPEEMQTLGLGEFESALADGQLVVLNPTLEESGEQPRLVHADGAPLEVQPVAASHAGLEVIPARLPGALVSPDIASRMGEPVRGGRVVVTSPGGHDLDRQTLTRSAQTVVDQFHDPDPELPEVAPAASTEPEPGDDVAPDLSSFEFLLPVMMGDELVDVSPSGPYNEVPFLAGTREEATQRMLSLGLLAVLVTLAGTVLALGSTRSQDRLLEMQGATIWLRARIGGLQAAVLSGSAAAFAALAGIGLPALSFAVYNGTARGELPMIPLMVPAEVLAGLVLLPLVAGGLATGLVAIRHQRRSLSLPAPG